MIEKNNTKWAQNRELFCHSRQNDKISISISVTNTHTKAKL